MPSDPLRHSLDHFHAELAADPDIQDALRQLNELQVPDPREQKFDDTPSPIYRSLVIGLAASVFFWAGLGWLIANWSW